MIGINQKLTLFIIILSLLLHISASYFSTGWLNPDEQSCILEYLNLKLGFASNPCFLFYNNNVTLDTSIKIRSWSQPYLYYLITNLFLFFNLNNFIYITFFLKLFSSFLGWLSILLFYQVT